MTGVGSSTTNTRSKTREHSAKLHLDSWIVSARAHVSWLGSLNSLREWGVAATAMQFWAQIEHSSVHRTFTLSVVLLSLHHLRTLVLLQRHRTLYARPPSLHSGVCRVRGWRWWTLTRQLAAHVRRSFLDRFSRLVGCWMRGGLISWSEQ